MLIPKCSTTDVSDLGVGREEQEQSLRRRQQRKKLNNYPKDNGALSGEEL